jgi:hypothetical protein
MNNSSKTSSPNTSIPDQSTTSTSASADISISTVPDPFAIERMLALDSGDSTRIADILGRIQSRTDRADETVGFELAKPDVEDSPDIGKMIGDGGKPRRRTIRGTITHSKD